MKKNISVLGSTGSVGTQTLEVARTLKIKIHAVSANKNIALLENQIREFKPRIAAVYDEKSAKILKENIKDTNTKIVAGISGLCEAAAIPDADITLTALSGMIGLKPTLEAINAGKDIALANKETLVAGGDLVMNAAKNQNVKILPVDSEHSAIFQCLEGCKNKNYVKKLILTASGGPFFGKSVSDLQKVTVKDALNHPSWSMGAKITVDSATMINKGLEIIEATHLFNMPEDKIEVVVHPQSIIHSMIEYKDGSVIAQMGTPSMKTPIQHALTYPEKMDSQVPQLNLSEIQNLSFFSPDNQTFEAIDICRKAIKLGGSAPIIINAANEEAVKLFLSGKINFLEIISLIREARDNFCVKKINNLDDILSADEETRVFIKSLL